MLGLQHWDILAGLAEGDKHPEERERSQHTGETRDRGLRLATCPGQKRPESLSVAFLRQKPLRLALEDRLALERGRGSHCPGGGGANNGSGVGGQQEAWTEQ